MTEYNGAVFLLPRHGDSLLWEGNGGLPVASGVATGGFLAHSGRLDQYRDSASPSDPPQDVHGLPFSVLEHGSTIGEGH